MNRYLTFFFYLTIVLISYYLYLNIGTDFDESLLYSTLILAFVALIPFVFRREPVVQLKRQYLRSILIFLLGFFIVHFQKYSDYILGNIALSELNRITSLTAINKAALLSLAGLASVLAGYQFYMPRNKNRSSYRKEKPEKTVSVKPLINLLALTFFIILVFFRNYYLSSQYGNENGDSLRVYLSLIFNAIFFSIIIINSHNASIRNIDRLSDYFRSFGLFFFIIYFGYILLVMISGDRGPVIYTIAALFFSYIVVSKHKIKMIPILILLFSSAVMISLMGLARSLDKDISYFDRFTIATQEYERQSFSPYTAEMSGSSRTLEYAVEYVPEKHPYLYGLFKLKDIIFVIPFSSNITRMFFDNSFQYKGSASFLTWIEQGDNPSSGAGATVVADLYIDWGWIGVILGLFLFGLLLRKLDIIIFCNSVDNISSFYLILGIVLFAMAIYIPRSSLLLQLRLVVWVWLIVNIYKLVVSSNAKK